MESELKGLFGRIRSCNIQVANETKDYSVSRSTKYVLRGKFKSIDEQNHIESGEEQSYLFTKSKKCMPTGCAGMIKFTIVNAEDESDVCSFIIAFNHPMMAFKTTRVIAAFTKATNEEEDELKDSYSDFIALPKTSKEVVKKWIATTADDLAGASNQSNKTKLFQLITSKNGPAKLDYQGIHLEAEVDSESAATIKVKVQQKGVTQKEVRLLKKKVRLLPENRPYTKQQTNES